MASGDFADLYSKALRRAGRDTSDTAYDVPRAKEAVNEAIVYTCAREDWEFLKTEGQFTIDSTADVYTFDSIATALSLSPHSVEKIISLVNDTSDSRTLIGMSWHELEELSSSTQGGDARGIPTHYAVWERRVRFYPWPDQQYTIGAHIVRRHGELSVNSDTPLIPLPFRASIIVPYAASVLLSEDGGVEAQQEANLLMARYERAYEAMLKRYASARAPILNIVAPTFGQDLPGGAL
jgi:hypothetical protein